MVELLSEIVQTTFVLLSIMGCLLLTFFIPIVVGILVYSSVWLPRLEPLLFMSSVGNWSSNIRIYVRVNYCSSVVNRTIRAIRIHFTGVNRMNINDKFEVSTRDTDNNGREALLRETKEKLDKAIDNIEDTDEIIVRVVVCTKLHILRNPNA